jgi:hypothetical protein
MKTHQLRFHERSVIKIPLAYRTPEPDHFGITRLLNISEGGLYFETYRPMESNLNIEVFRTKLPKENQTPGAFVGHKARILWSSELHQHRRQRYGVGIQFVNEAHVPSYLPNFESSSYRCDLCDQISNDEIIWRKDLYVFLCPPCFKHLDSIPDGTQKESIIRFLIGNVL